MSASIAAQLVPKVIQLFSCSPQLSMTISLVINIKMPLLAFSYLLAGTISCSAMFSWKDFAIASHLRFISMTNFMSMKKKFYNLGAWSGAFFCLVCLQTKRLYRAETTCWSAGLDSLVGCASDWRSGVCGFNPRRGRQHSLIMKYFLRSFSPLSRFRKGSCQFLAKEWAQFWLTA